MAMGKPVIATRLHGLLREFGDDNGVLWIDQSKDSLKKAMELVNEVPSKHTAKQRGNLFVPTTGPRSSMNLSRCCTSASNQREAPLTMRGTLTTFSHPSKKQNSG